MQGVSVGGNATQINKTDNHYYGWPIAIAIFGLALAAIIWNQGNFGVPEKQPNYIKMTEPPVQRCDPKANRLPSTTDNILRTPRYARAEVNMRPDEYGKGVTITAEPNLSAYYRVKTGVRCNTGNGETHGGFQYVLDYEKIIPGRKYSLSFCAWSVTDDEIGLGIEHTNGGGQVSSLSRTAILTREPHLFIWDSNVGGKGLVHINSGVNQQLLGFIFDYQKDRACDPKDELSKNFANKEFVIGDVRLELTP